MSYKLIIAGASVIVIVVVLLSLTIIYDDFKVVKIPLTSENLSKSEACNLINGDWNSTLMICDDIDLDSFNWLEG